MANDGTVKIGVGFEADKLSLSKISSQIHKSLSGVSSAAHNTLNSTFNFLANSAKSTLDIFTKGTAAAAAGAAGISGYALKVGKEFEASMSNVMATMGITKDTIQNGVNSYELLKDAAAKAGESTIYTASEAAEALNYLALAGYDAQKAVGALPSVLKLAQAGGMDLAYASDLVTDSMAALGIEATSDNLTEFGDKLAKTASSANANVSQLGEAILTVGGTAKSLSGGTTELNATLGVLANRGIKGAEGGTALRNIMTSLTSPTKKAREELAALGVEIFDSEGNMRNLNNIFMDFKNATKNLTDEEQKQALRSIFNKYDLASAEALLSGAGEEFETLANKIDNADGAMEQMAETMTQNLDGQLKSLQSKTEALGITIYDKLNKPSADFLSTINEMVAGLNNALRESGLEGMTTKFGEYFSELVLSGTKKLPDLMQAGTNISLAISKGINAKSSEISRAIVSALQALPSFIKDNISVALDTGGTILDGVIEGMKSSPDAIADTVLYLMFAMPEFLLQRLDVLIPIGGEIITKIADGIAEKSELIADTLVNAMLMLPQYITQNIDTLLSVGSTFISAIANGISQNKDELAEQAAYIVSAFYNFIITNLPKIVKAGKELIKAFANAISKEFPKVKPLADIVKKLADNFVPLTKIIVPVVAGFKGFSIVQKVVQWLIPLISKIKTAGSVLGLLKIAVGALGGPVGIAITAIGGLTLAIAALTLTRQDDLTETEKAIEKQQKLAEKLEKESEQYDKMKQSAKEAADAEQNQMDRAEELWKELEQLADSQGKVSEADEARAKFITEELGRLTGTEIEMIDGQIQKYDELKQSIQSVIDKKRAEATLSAYTDVYEESIKRKDELEEKLRDAYLERQNIPIKRKELLDKIQQSMNDAGFGYRNAEDFINEYKDRIANKSFKYDKDRENWRDAIGEENLREWDNLRGEAVEVGNNYNVWNAELAEVSEMIVGYEKAYEETLKGNYENVEKYLGYQRDSQLDYEEFKKKSEEEQTKAILGEYQTRKAEEEVALAQRRRNNEQYNDAVIKDYQDSISELIMWADSAGLDISKIFDISDLNKFESYKYEIAQRATMAAISESPYKPNSAYEYQQYYNSANNVTTNNTYNITQNINDDWDVKKAEEAAFQMYRAKRINDAGKGLTGG